VRKRLCKLNGVAVMRKTRGIGVGANRSAGGLGHYAARNENFVLVGGVKSVQIVGDRLIEAVKLTNVCAGRGWDCQESEDQP
jgi:hypothetical protein